MLKNFWYAVEFSTAVRATPRKVRVLGQDLVLFRTSNTPTASVVALSGICVHRGGDLAAGTVRDGCLRCPYHGWSYTPSGVCDRIPANAPDSPIPKRARLDSYPVAERYGFIWVFLGDLPPAERPPIPPLAEFEHPGFKPIYGEFTWRAHYVRVMENGLDFAHGPFVHRNSFGDIHRPQIPEYKVVPAAGFGDWGSSAMVTLPAAPPTGLWRILGSLFAGRSRPDVPVSLSFYLPNIIRIHIRPRPGWDIVIFDSNIPVDEENTRTLWLSLRNFLRGDWADANARSRTHKIFCEDQPIVESVRPVGPPAVEDHASELLVRSDQLVVAYRRLRRRAFELGWGLDLVRAAQLSVERPHVLPSPARRVLATQDLFVFSEVPALPAGRSGSSV